MNREAVPWAVAWVMLVVLVLYGFAVGVNAEIQTVIGWAGGVVSAELYTRRKRRAPRPEGRGAL